MCPCSLQQPSTICPFIHLGYHLQKTSQNIPFQLGLPPVDTDVPYCLLRHWAWLRRGYWRYRNLIDWLIDLYIYIYIYILNILLYNHISKASSLSEVTLVSVRVSAPYKSIDQLQHFAMRDLNSMLMFLHVSIFDILYNAVLAISNLLLISLSHFPSPVAM